ncbi:ROK family protein [Streptococcus sp. CSL10205-OR2]|uniref:ROK family protein n=1 Tax=Streptococcus sp. CSL10205-OR2 TaxID=2980558 RepID=UPI0021DA60BB|nr:ROK family protein [Streptococcus sp. CSL10205-OR2]MCU9533343.1 ROK family protein [Streptococcus sp. CSL10205-OR2]
MTYYLVIDIGGTFIKYGILGENENLIEQEKMATNAHQGGPHILQVVKDLVKWYSEKYDLSGVCISTAGMVDPDKGEVFYAGPQIPNYAGTNFKHTIESEFGISCSVENDVNCAGLAESISGNARDSEISLCLTIGTGIGGCLVIDNNVFHGYSNSACEVGYIHLPDGAFQDLASTSALVKYVATLENDSESDWSGYRIFEEAKKGHPNCIIAIDRMVNYLAQGIANICYVANPQTVVLGGGIMAQKNFLKEKIEKALATYLVESLLEKTKLVFAHHENNAGMLGAYYHFRHQHH